MLVQTIYRGNVVNFDAIFIDQDDTVEIPASVHATINYLDMDGYRASVIIDLSEQSDGSFFGQWITDVAKAGRVYWSVKATSPEAAQDGYFDLAGNPANLAT